MSEKIDINKRLNINIYLDVELYSNGENDDDFRLDISTCRDGFTILNKTETIKLYEYLKECLKDVNRK